MQICGDAKDCMFGEYPSMFDVNLAFGKNTSTAWLVIQLTDLSEYCGVKDKLKGAALEETAYTIATDFGYLRISEMMLFFHRFKSGKYGRFYGNIDPLVITTSLRIFISERAEAIDERDKELKDLRYAEEAKLAVTREEYDAMDKMVISWETRDIDLIHKIQEYFGMPKGMTVNKRSEYAIMPNDPRYPKLLEGEKKGLYQIIPIHSHPEALAKVIKS